MTETRTLSLTLDTELVEALNDEAERQCCSVDTIVERLLSLMLMDIKVGREEQDPEEAPSHG